MSIWEVACQFRTDAPIYKESIWEVAPMSQWWSLGDGAHLARPRRIRIVSLERLKDRKRPANAQNCTTNAVTTATSESDLDITFCSKAHCVREPTLACVNNNGAGKTLEPQRLHAI